MGYPLSSRRLIRRTLSICHLVSIIVESSPQHHQETYVSTELTEATVLCLIPSERETEGVSYQRKCHDKRLREVEIPCEFHEPNNAAAEAMTGQSIVDRQESLVKAFL